MLREELIMFRVQSNARWLRNCIITLNCTVTLRTFLHNLFYKRDFFSIMPVHYERFNDN